MKKFLVTILCFVYVAASSGATINFHYCMGKFIGWEFAIATPATCNNCGMVKEQKKGCCSDKHATLQLKKDQLASNINNILSNNICYIHHNFLQHIWSSSLFSKSEVLQLKHVPPLIQPVSAFLFNHVFRI